MLKIFVSHTHEDKNLVQQLKETIYERYENSLDNSIKLHISSDKKNGAKPGKNWKLWINEKISNCDLMFVIITSNTKNSLWIEYEIKLAQGKKKHIVPILINNECKIPEILLDIQAIKDLKNNTDNITTEISTSIIHKINEVLTLKNRSNNDRPLVIFLGLVVTSYFLGRKLY